MSTHLSAVIALIAAAGAIAAPFEIISIDAGTGPASLTGVGIMTSTGSFFNAGTGGPLDRGVIALAPANAYTAAGFEEFDSHFSIDPFGPSARNRSVATANNSHATLTFYGDYGPAGGIAANHDEGDFNPGGFYVLGPGGHISNDSGNPITTPNHLARGSVGFAPPPVPSYFAPNAAGGRSTRDGIFLGRFTVQAGATISGSLRIDVVDPSSPSGFSSAVLTLGGPAVLVGTSSGPQLLALSAYPIHAGLPLRGDSFDITIPTSVDPPLDDSGMPLPFGPAHVYDLWAAEIPTPGAATFLVLCSAMAARRKR